MDTDNDKPSDKPGYVQVDESVRGSMLKTIALSFLSIVMPGMATNNILKIKSFSRIFNFNFARVAILTPNCLQERARKVTLSVIR